MLAHCDLTVYLTVRDLGELTVSMELAHTFTGKTLTKNSNMKSIYLLFIKRKSSKVKFLIQSLNKPATGLVLPVLALLLELLFVLPELLLPVLLELLVPELLPVLPELLLPLLLLPLLLLPLLDAAVVSKWGKNEERHN